MKNDHKRRGLINQSRVECERRKWTWHRAYQRIRCTFNSLRTNKCFRGKIMNSNKLASHTRMCTVLFFVWFFFSYFSLTRELKGSTENSFLIASKAENAPSLFSTFGKNSIERNSIFKCEMWKMFCFLGRLHREPIESANERKAGNFSREI